MSTYVISDIHGNYAGYMEMLRKINFSDSDTLYVIGDVVDRGDEGIKVLQDMMLRYNVIPILGNHEYMLMLSSKFLTKEITEESIKEVEDSPEIFQGLVEWINVGGNPTIKEMSKLTPEEREDIFDYLGEFTLYETVTVNDKDFILVHAGLSNFEPQRELDDYRLDELIFYPSDYENVYFEDKYLITGHLPTRAIRMKLGENSSTAFKDEIFIANNQIAIDCASGYPNGRLGCLRLDDMKEFYVEKL